MPPSRKNLLKTARQSHRAAARAPVPLIRRYATSGQPDPSRPPAEPEVPTDPRPRWAFTLMRVSNIAIIPATLLYAVFVADFGDYEHVFKPARRWLDRQRAAFFSLSPAEREAAAAALADPSASVQPAGSERR